jgi:hypothetical protein
MKKTKNIKRISKPKKEIFSSHIPRRHVRIIPWAMVLLAVFYLVSLIAIIRLYPELFSVSNSFAETQTTNLIGSNTSLEKAALSGNDTTLTKTPDPSSTNTRTANSILSDTNKESSTSSLEKTFSATTVLENGVNTAINISPKLTFIKPDPKATLKDTAGIKVSVSGAGKIEFYAIKNGSLTEHYLGNGSRVENNVWKLDFNTKNKPNGEYAVFAKITNEFGTYNSEKITIYISNEQSVSTAIIPKSNTPTAESEKSAQPVSISGSTPQNNTAQNVAEVRQNIEKRDTQSGVLGAPKNQTIADSLPQNIDSDRDGVSNDEERRIGTDPYSADSDKDGYLDGDEIRAGSDPLKSAKIGNDKIVFESPKDKGEVKTDIVKIDSAEMVSPEGEKGNNTISGISTEKNLQIKGRGLPYSFVTIYIYSDTPTIVTVMTDENGNWTYTMDKNIEDGQHEVYVAITDNGGHINAKSSPFAFIKTAQAVTKVSAEEISKSQGALLQSPVSASRSRQVTAIGIIIIISLFTAIALIGLYLVYHYHHTKELVTQKDYLDGK